MQKSARGLVKGTHGGDNGRASTAVASLDNNGDDGTQITSLWVVHSLCNIANAVFVFLLIQMD